MINKRLKSARLEKNLTQERLSELLGLDSGGGGSRIAHYESGRYEPSFQLVKTMSQILDVPEYYFYIENDNEASFLLQRFRIERMSKKDKNYDSLFLELENIIKQIQSKIQS